MACLGNKPKQEKIKHKKSHEIRGLIFFCSANYLAAGASAAGAAASAAGAAAAAVSTAAAAVSTASTAVVSAAASALASACLQDTTVNAAITAKLKNTFFILLNIKG
jgi:hypothetical protein